MREQAGERIAVVGLGRVGLPVAVAFARHDPRTLGFDTDAVRVDELRRGLDRTGGVPPSALAEVRLRVTHRPDELRGASLFVVAVPTPVDAQRRPDLSALRRASETVGGALGTGAVVVYESTVFPGVTEDVCGPILERVSGLRCGVDFTLGYSPERINPGDPDHTLEKITKVVSGQDAATLERVAAAYGAIVPAGVHRAPSIQVAEAAKLVENTQRDLNIALMNELAIVCEKQGLRTKDVLDAAGTKWNFARFSPGLVGGHCSGIGPHYLSALADSLGYQPHVISAGRRVNDEMGAFVARKLVRLLEQAGVALAEARVGILGLTFKEDVHEVRSSRVLDIVHELRAHGIAPLVADPHASAAHATEHGVALVERGTLRELDALVIAVAHDAYRRAGADELAACVRRGGVVVDVKSIIEPARLRPDLTYWSL